MTNKSPIPDRLKALREEAGLSIRQVAEGLELSSSSYNHYETRFKKQYLPLDLAQRIALILLPHGIAVQRALALSGYDRGLDMTGDEIDELGPLPHGFSENRQPRVDVSSLLDTNESLTNSPDDPENTIKIAIVGASVQIAATVDEDGIDELIRRLNLAKEMIAN